MRIEGDVKLQWEEDNRCSYLIWPPLTSFDLILFSLGWQTHFQSLQKYEYWQKYKLNQAPNVNFLKYF